MNNQSALITGSSKGLGRELAKIFAKNSYDVILHGRDNTRLLGVGSLISQEGSDYLTIAGDLREENTIQILAKKAEERGIDILINNAAISVESPFEGVDKETLEKILSVNLIAPIKLARLIYPIFLKRGYGTIVNINSIDSLRPKRNVAAYAAAKGGLKAFTDCLRYEAKPKGIKVVGVYLGGIDTEMYKATGRDASSCMPPSKVAETIFECCKDRGITSVDELTIDRKSI